MPDNTEFIKKEVYLNEYTMHKYIQSLEIVNIPKIISYDLHNKIMIMEKIPNDCISNMYGENDNDIDIEIYEEIRKIIKRLYDNEIEYSDITGYNFIEYQNKIWIIDFEHAKFCDYSQNKSIESVGFIEKFMNGHNGWNPEFR
jgi:tRNA A-37 threonylcarbamoyl transferase component Bud32